MTAKYQAFNLTLPPDLFDAVTNRVRGPRERSATIARDLDRLYTLYKLALREAPLAVGEACLICDVLNGTLMDASSVAMLWAEVADGIRLDGLDKKWGVDGEALVKRLKGLDRLTCLALVDAAERFWVAAPSSQESTEVLVRQFFHVRDADEE
ncbi:hypothetical protein [Symbiobacterium terraclitae]|uniref:hypothetical protein n=1 Tax=Symbiobacterium terraclitae TaxID=557451 RepID=UPI0035B54CEA